MRRQVRKTPKSAKGKNYNFPVQPSSPTLTSKPIFSFHYLQNSYCISKCSRPQKIGFVDTMRILSSMLWNEIYSSGHHQHGKETIPRHRFKVPIPSSISDDENLIAIRFHENHPMVGVRRGDVFHVVWFDRNFTVYDHGS